MEQPAPHRRELQKGIRYYSLLLSIIYTKLSAL